MGSAARPRLGLPGTLPAPRAFPGPVIGADVGGVVIGRVAEVSDTSFFGDRPLNTLADPG